MAKISPFPALRYNLSQVNAQEVLTQPYDKITPAMQEEYYARSSYNLVRVILGKPEAGDGDSANVYTRAKRYLHDWRASGVLTQDPEPSFYLYVQEFTVPGSTATKRRSGLIAAGQLHDYADKVVFRHEQTLAKPKSDRLNLLRATRTHAGQIFMLYTDPEKKVERLLANPGAPLVDVTDDYGVRNQLWRISDAKTIAGIQDALGDKKLMIADGHHRYETALAYRDERRAAAGKTDASASYERVMMTLVNTADEGLAILPTHRVVHGLKNLSVPDFLNKISPDFEMEQIEDGKKTLAEASSGTNLRLISKNGNYFLRARPESVNRKLAHLSPAQRELDVIVLHKMLLEGALGMSEESIRNQEHIHYVREADEATERVRKGEAEMAFLIEPVRIEEMEAVAFAGEVMPQKSTDFYPKLLSGMTFYSLE
ncbi:MAG: DUF1015 domain-containing protein [Terriglobales bacterium]|jgi:uncharacterized protein (DUF1015 family)